MCKKENKLCKKCDQLHALFVYQLRKKKETLFYFGTNCQHVFKNFWGLLPRADVCCVRDVCGAHGMERNIGDQLNKAFEAYRQVSIEKDNAKKELQQMVTAWGKQLCVK